MLWKRVATALVLLPVLAASILCSKGRLFGWPFLLVVGTSSALCAFEMFRMFLRGTRDRLAGTALAVLVFLFGSILPDAVALPAVLLCVVLAALHPLPGAENPGEKTRTAAMLALGAVYVGGLFSLYPRTLTLPQGEHWVMLGVLAVSAGDTMAYFTGRAVGRRKLAPAAVSVTPVARRISSGVPIASSSSRICRDSAGCTMPAARAPPITLPACATATK